MYHHVKKLMYTVRVDEPDPRFGNILLEQLGGAKWRTGSCDAVFDSGAKLRRSRSQRSFDGHWNGRTQPSRSTVGSLARLHLKPMKFDREKAEADPLIAIAGGGGVNLFNSQVKCLDS